jgi:hypothetical protein
MSTIYNDLRPRVLSFNTLNSFSSDLCAPRVLSWMCFDEAELRLSNLWIVIGLLPWSSRSSRNFTHKTLIL